MGGGWVLFGFVPTRANAMAHAHCSHIPLAILFSSTITVSLTQAAFSTSSALHKYDSVQLSNQPINQGVNQTQVVDEAPDYQVSVTFSGPAAAAAAQDTASDDSFATSLVATSDSEDITAQNEERPADWVAWRSKASRAAEQHISPAEQQMLREMTVEAGWNIVPPPSSVRVDMRAAMLLVGHRGASHVAPENTLSAFRHALDKGAAGFELDLQILRTEEVVVLHDGSLQRTSTGMATSARDRERCSATLIFMVDARPIVPEGFDQSAFHAGARCRVQ